MNNLPQLASLLKSRDAIDYKIATIIGHPTQVQSVGEYIASVIFGIALTRKIVVHKNSDGHFVRGPLAGQPRGFCVYGEQIQLVTRARLFVWRLRKEQAFLESARGIIHGNRLPARSRPRTGFARCGGRRS